MLFLFANDVVDFAPNYSVMHCFQVNVENEVLWGNAVAISENMALTSLHGREITDVTLKCGVGGAEYRGKVTFSKCETHYVDIAVITLNEGNRFESYYPLATTRLLLGNKLTVFGWKPSLVGDDMNEMVAHAEVNTIEATAGSSLLQAAYVGYDGLSGGGVITCSIGGKPFVVGVHVAAHDDTVAPPAVKKVKSSTAATADSVSQSNSSLASSIHAHQAYCLICEAARVDGLKEHVSGTTLNSSDSSSGGSTSHHDA